MTPLGVTESLGSSGVSGDDNHAMDCRSCQINALPATHDTPDMAFGFALGGAGIAVIFSTTLFDVILSAVLNLVALAIVSMQGNPSGEPTG